MTKLIASLVVAGTLIAGLSAAQAEPRGALADAARLGLLTPGGVFDGR